MPAIQSTASILTVAVNDNVLQGSQFEYLPYDAEIEIGVVGSATGFIIDIYSGTDVLCESYLPSTQNRFPVYPDDMAFSDYALAGEHLKIRARNISAGTLTLFYRVQITPA